MNFSMEQFTESIKSLTMAELGRVVMTTVKEMERRSVKEKKEKKEKKEMPKQLRPYNAWVAFVKNHANENGWESFTVTSKDTEVEIKGSEEVNGEYVYEGSVTEKNKKGLKFLPKDAMSLAKHYWSTKDKTGIRNDLYEEFQREFVKEQKVEVELEVESEVELESEEEKEEKVPTASKIVKEKVKPVIPVVTPVTPVKVVKAKPMASKVLKKKEKEWTCPDDGELHVWMDKETVYYRDFKGYVWSEKDGEAGEFLGHVVDGKIVECDEP